MVEKDLKNLSVNIVTHVYATGPSFKLEEYLRYKVKKLVFIGHPFSFAKDTRSFIRVYEKGTLIKEKKFFVWKGSEFFFYFKDLLLTCWWTVLYARRTDYFIGVNNFNVFAGLLIKKFINVGKVIFYTIDYVPQRFNNRLINSLYHWLDRLAVHESHRVWNLSSIMVSEREKNGVGKKYREKQIVVPIGTDIRIKNSDLSKFDGSKIVFLGHLRNGQGIEILISAMKDVVVKVKNTKLVIIGGGPLENALKAKIKKLGLEKNVELVGFIASYDEVKKIMSDAAMAVAPYEDDDKTYTRFTDPGKPKDYLSCGLPVIITKVPQVALEIEKRKCGIAVNYSKEEIANAIVKLLMNRELLLAFRKNSLEMAKEYQWDKIFGKAFEKTI